MATINKRPLKAFVRFDGTGRIVPSSLILRRKKPKVGKWVEIPAYECCNYVPSSTTTTSTTTTAAPTVSVRWTNSYDYTVCTGGEGYSTIVVEPLTSADICSQSVLNAPFGLSFVDQGLVLSQTVYLYDISSGNSRPFQVTTASTLVALDGCSICTTTTTSSTSTSTTTTTTTAPPL